MTVSCCCDGTDVVGRAEGGGALADLEGGGLNRLGALEYRVDVRPSPLRPWSAGTVVVGEAAGRVGAGPERRKVKPSTLSSSPNIFGHLPGSDGEVGRPGPARGNRYRDSAGDPCASPTSKSPPPRRRKTRKPAAPGGAPHLPFTAGRDRDRSGVDDGAGALGAGGGDACTRARRSSGLTDQRGRDPLSWVSDRPWSGRSPCPVLQGWGR